MFVFYIWKKLFYIPHRQVADVLCNNVFPYNGEHHRA